MAGAALLLLGKKPKEMDESAPEESGEAKDDGKGMEAAMESLASALSDGDYAAAAKAFKNAHDMCCEMQSEDSAD